MISINSPAKINLFLKIINKRQDGFHNIETSFQLINIFDYLSFQTTNSHGEIKFECSDIQLNTKSNIVFKVAKYLQSLTENPSGVVISLKKNIPIGAGLGGGSSNAASTLVALNEIWSLKLSREKLQKIGESFGSDVPFFVFGENAYGSGKGEILQKKDSTGKNYLIIYPNFRLSTQKMFELFDNESMTESEGNSFLNTYLKTNESVRLFYEKIAKDNTISLSGSGSSMFIEYGAKREILKILKKIPKNWRFFLCEALQYSQLKEMIEDGV